jgi:hypothetical protein
MLQYLRKITLLYNGDCSLAGITPDFHIYVEELHDDWTTQHLITFDGIFLNTELLSLPSGLIQPQPARTALDLNFTGGRYRGLREPERVHDWLKPLTVQEKMLFAPHLNLAPMAILGIAESVVHSEAQIDTRYLVCRRLRIAYALPEIRYDQEQQPYDYDTHALYLAHFHQQGDLSEALDGLPDVDLCHPMDCIAYNGYLIIADGGEGQQKSSIHLWRVV